MCLELFSTLQNCLPAQVSTFIFHSEIQNFAFGIFFNNSFEQQNMIAMIMQVFCVLLLLFLIAINVCV